MKITLANGKEYEATFDVENTCFHGFSQYDTTPRKRYLDLLTESRMFISLTGSGIRSGATVIQKPVSQIPISEFEMIETGAGLVVCDPDGEAVCSLCLDEESNKILVCSLQDTDCL